MIGEPDAGKPHVRFDEGVQETCGSRNAPAPYSTASPLAQKFFSASRRSNPHVSQADGSVWHTPTRAVSRLFSTPRSGCDTLPSRGIDMIVDTARVGAHATNGNALID